MRFDAVAGTHPLRPHRYGSAPMQLAILIVIIRLAICNRTVWWSPPPHLDDRPTQPPRSVDAVRLRGDPCLLAEINGAVDISPGRADDQTSW